MDGDIMTMNKTPLGTIQAVRWPKGVVTGLYKEDNIVSLEYNSQEQILELVINEDAVKENDIRVRYFSQEEFRYGG